MNYKFLGNAIDLFKYDLLTYLVKKDNLFLYYVPVITEPKERAYDPKLLVYELGSKNKELYAFLKELFSSEEVIDPSIIKEYFKSQGLDYLMYSRIKLNERFFREDKRYHYFYRAAKFLDQVSLRKLIYLDPDVGLNLNLKRRFRSNKEMYLQEGDIKWFLPKMNEGDALCFFQHLGNSNYSIEQRLEDLKEAFGEWVFVMGYTRVQGSFVFICKNKSDYQWMYQRSHEYFELYKDLKHAEKLFIR